MTCYAEQAVFVHLPSGAVNSVHTGAGPLCIHQKQNGIILRFSHLDRAVRGDGPHFGALFLRDTQSLPTRRIETLISRKRLHHIWRQATHKGHGAPLGNAKHILECLGEHPPVEIGPLHVSYPP
ncbi:MAG: hypothetical protein F4X83_11615 [Chloroflexi bacterium]|nr:hypothetical protein [Chloroflexota bacterium]